jgi:hypothetical protein
MSKDSKPTVNTLETLETHAIGVLFDLLACPSLMVPSGGETDVKLGFSLYYVWDFMNMVLNNMIWIMNRIS